MPTTHARAACSETLIPADFDDRLRPIAHPGPVAGWLNDPNAPIQYQGRYHLFYQHNPRAAGFDPHMHWGRLCSEDLAHWRRCPIALLPEPGGVDADGCWSGCAVRDENDRVHLLYSTPGQDVCHAVAADAALEVWHKDPVAVLAGQLAPGGTRHHRDPCVVRHQDEWLMVLGSQREGRGAIELWRSPDLVDWQRVGCLLHDDGHLPLALDHGRIWECPSLFELDGHWVLIIACCDWDVGLRRSVAYVGDFDGRRFQPRSGQLFDHGLGACYAAITCLDERGRRLLWSWICEGPGNRSEAWGWAGCLSWPLELRVVDGALQAAVPAELAGLRRPGSQRRLGAGTPGRGSSVDLELQLRDLVAFPRGLRVFDDGAGRSLRILIDPVGCCLLVDRSDWMPQCGENDNQRALHIVPLQPADLADCRLRVVVDRSLVQVHCNQRLRVTTRVYPTAGADGIAVIGDDVAADCWDLESCILSAT